MENIRKYNEMSTQERYERLERARNNSVKSRNSDLIEINYKKEKYKISANRLKKVIVTAFLVTALASTAVGIGLTRGVENLKDDNIIYEHVSEYNDIILDNTYRTADNEGHWYDTYNMARDILKKDDQNLALYTVYQGIKCGSKESKKEHMDRIVKSISSLGSGYQDINEWFGDCKNFDDYLIKNDCVDKKGNPSTKLYEKKMKTYILGKDAYTKSTFGENNVDTSESKVIK